MQVLSQLCPFGISLQLLSQKCSIIMHIISLSSQYNISQHIPCLLSQFYRCIIELLVPLRTSYYFIIIYYYHNITPLLPHCCLTHPTNTTTFNYPTIPNITATLLQSLHFIPFKPHECQTIPLLMLYIPASKCLHPIAIPLPSHCHPISLG